MSMEDIEMFSKHFASNLDVVIEFKENANPCTDGKTIILPKNMNKEVLFEMLATLIHETFHIRFTTMTQYTSFAAQGQSFAETLNVLEDIRIDEKAFKLYPECKDLYYMLYKYIMKDIEGFKKEPQAIRILKHMILKHKANKNKEFAEFYYDQDALKIIDKLNLNEDIAKTIKCKNTRDVTVVAMEVIKKIYKFLKENKDGVANDPEFDPNGSSLESFKKKIEEAKAKKEEKLKDQINEKNEKIKEHDKLKKEIAELQSEFAEVSQDNSLSNKEKMQELNKISKKAEDKQQEDTALIKELDEDVREIHRNQAAIARDAKKMSETKDNSEEVFFGDGQSKNMNGFDALKPEDIKSNENYDKIKLERSLDEDLREFFIEKREERINDEEGNRLDSRRLHKLFTNDNNVFTEQQEKEFRTKVLFLVDRSGSMGSRENIIKQAFFTLLTALYRIVDEDNLPIDIAVVAFNEKVQILKAFESQKTPQQIVDSYHICGGTILLEAYNKARDMLESSGEDCEKVLICMTDGEVNDYEIDEINNLATDMKSLFIGINLNIYSKKCKALFGKYNITDIKEVLHILTTAIKESIK